MLTCSKAMQPATSSCDSQRPHNFFRMTMGQELRAFWWIYSLYQLCEEFKIIPILQMRRLSLTKAKKTMRVHIVCHWLSDPAESQRLKSTKADCPESVQVSNVALRALQPRYKQNSFKVSGLQTSASFLSNKYPATTVINSKNLQ